MLHFIKSLFLAIVILIAGKGYSQEVIDQIVAVVGDEPILKSDIETQYIQMLSQGYYSNAVDAKCNVFEELLFQKLLLDQAQKDSLEVTSKEVDKELNRRLGVFINKLGSERKLEEFYGKSIREIREEFRGIIYEQLLTQRMQQDLTGDINVTPSEVKRYFNSLPEDSMPVLKAKYELRQIVMYPEISKAEKDRCKAKLNDFRQRVLDGEKFSTLAIMYSEDPGSAGKGGELGFVSRQDLVPEFASVAFTLEEGEVSRIVKTEFGYHILKLIEKKGELVNVRHILITPKTGAEQGQATRDSLQKIRDMITGADMGFAEAAETYSEDEETKNNGGKMMNPYTGTSQFELDQLEPMTQQEVKNLSEGDISQVYKARDARGKVIYRILKIDRKSEKHVANLEEDYQHFYEMKMQLKKQNTISEWIKEKLQTTFVKIDGSYQNCDFQYAEWL